MQPSFYFHDYETFGINPAFDRPAQFAGVRTDDDFNIIEEPLIIYCKPAPDYLPNPEAVLITGITPQLALQKGVCEAEFTQKIHAAFSQANACILGYNNIRFDDEVTRNIFYRNFYDPYAYSWQNGNSRWDLLDLVRACYALRPEGFNWPHNDNGLPSFRLELLTKANNIRHEQAHDAMSDVYATIAMAKLIKQQQPKLFDYFFTLRNKKAVADLIDVIEMKPLVHVSGMLGAYRGNTTLVAPIDWHPVQANAVIVCDLTGNLEQLLTLDTQTLRERLYTKSDHLADPSQRVPLKLIHINKCPILAPINTLSSENATRLGINKKTCLLNWQWLVNNQQQIKEKIVAIFNQSYEHPAQQDVDGMIYQGFFDQHDKQIGETIRQTAPQQLSLLNIAPHDNRLKSLFLRYKARNYPETLTVDESKEWQHLCRDKLNESTVYDYLLQLENLSHQHQDNPEQIALLKQLYHYCRYLVA